jgi:hypothetical protein
LRIGVGSYFSTPSELESYTKTCNPQPLSDCTRKEIMKIVSDTELFTAKTQDLKTEIESNFPEEYAIAGWFRWNHKAKVATIFYSFPTRNNLVICSLGFRSTTKAPTRIANDLGTDSLPHGSEMKKAQY